MKRMTLLALALGLLACGDDPNPQVNPNNSNNQTNNPTNNQTNNPTNNSNNQTNILDITQAKSSLERITNPNVPAGDLQSLVDGNTEFALDLLKELGAQEEGNIVYSPHSISVALGMTYAGARGTTETAMASTMNFNLPQAQLHPAFNLLDQELSSRGQGAQASDGTPFKLNIANALWLRLGSTFETDFLDTLALNYGAGANLLDFAADPEAARTTINDWVEDKTEDLIKELLPPGTITGDTAAVLTNAIYFNASWLEQFPEESQNGTFNLGDGSTVTVPMMRQMSQYGHAERTDFHAIELPYDGQEVSFVALFPKSGTVEGLEANLSATELNDALAALTSKTVDLTMPRFKFETPLPLTETLQDMGMEVAFSSEANFTGISQELNLQISAVIHKAIIDVNEKGTEAAAATAVVVIDTSVPVAEEEFVLDRPFLFLIRDVETGAILFIGRLADPS